MEENLKEFQAVGYLVILKTIPSCRVSRHIESRLEEARSEFPRRYFILLAKAVCAICQNVNVQQISVNSLTCRWSLF